MRHVWQRRALGMLLLCALGVVSVAPAQGVAVSADVNVDGCIDDLDLLELALWTGENVQVGHPLTSRFDLNQDGAINGLDEDVLLDQYGTCQ